MDEQSTKMPFLRGGVAVVTGAGSGIGRALAKQLSAAGCGLALADIDENSLVETAGMLPGKGAAVSTHVLDVADEAGVRAFAEDVENRHGRVTMLINNAGMALHGTFEEISLDDLRWLIGINFWGTVYGVKHFLPILRQQPRAHIVNLSSIFGIVAPAGQTAYSASKFAVRGFTEALRHELEGSSVFVSCVHPGAIQTPIAERGRLGANAPKARKNENVSRWAQLAKTSPEDAAARILRGVERRAFSSASMLIRSTSCSGFGPQPTGRRSLAEFRIHPAPVDDFDAIFNGGYTPRQGGQIVHKEKRMAFARAAKTAEIAPGTIKEFQVEGKAVAVANVGGNFYAINNTCLHRGGPLGQGPLEGNIVTCPWHGWEYDVTTGKVSQNPAVGVDCYPLEVRGDEIFVNAG